MLKASIKRNKSLSRLSRKLNQKFSSTARGEAREPLDIAIGDVNNSFELQSRDYFEDYDVTLYKFKHQRLGTTHYHIDTPDTDNTIAFNFTTPPDDHTGKPHILEHIALCGSEKYPARDPFFNMLKRSLSTFMNAWTGPDFTSYPFSTTNEADFYNLLSVYAESALKPNLNKTDFLQEGWRFDFEDVDNEEKLVYKGVVYNEMKGVYENPSNIFMEKLQNALLRGTAYEYNSGGDPDDIPNITHQDLRDFHQLNYHPSNASIFSYGDLNPLAHQKFLEDNFLQKFEPSTRRVANGSPTLSAPQRLRASKPKPAQVIEEGKDATYGVGFLCNEISENLSDSLGLSILSYLLFHTPKSPFYVEFLESGIASGYCAGVGYESTLKHASFVIGFDNVEEGKAEELEKKIFEVLGDVAEQGFDENMVEGVLHLIESNSKIAKNNFGLQLFQNLLGGINHGVDEVIHKSLKITENIEEIRENAQKGYFQNLVKKYLLNNERRVHLELVSDENFMETKVNEENKKLEEIQKNLSEAQIQTIKQEAEELKAAQESEQDTEVLPTLTVADIPIQEEPTLYSIEDLPSGNKVYMFDKQTNGVVHLRIRMNLQGVDSSTVNFLSMLSSFFTELGTKKNSYDDFNELVRLYISSFDFSVNYSSNPKDQTEIQGFGLVRVSFLERNVKMAMKLLREFLTKPDFADSDRIENLVRMGSASAAKQLVNNANQFAVEYGMASGSPSHRFYNSLVNVNK